MKKDHILKLSEIEDIWSYKKFNIMNKNTLLIDENSGYKLIAIHERTFYKKIKKIILKNGVYLNYAMLYNFDTSGKESKKIIFSKNENLDLDGITIDYDIALKSNGLYIEICRDLSNKVNIVFDNKIENIECPPFCYSIHFENINDTLKITISNNNEDNIILVNSNGITKKYIEYKDIELSDKNIVNSKLDLHMYTKYKNIIIGNNDVIEQLILDTNIIGKNVSFYRNNKVNDLKFIDSDMKLIPENKIISINGNLYIIENSDNVLTLFVESDENKIINLYKNGDVQIIDKNYIEKNFPKIKKWEMFKGYQRCIAIIEHNKKNKFTFFINNKRYEINSSFKRYLMLNNNRCFWLDIKKNLMLDDRFNKLLINNDWHKLFSDTLNKEDFDKLYNKYLKYMDKLKQLKSLGISNKTLYYACAIDFDKNKNLKYFKGIKEMIDCFDGKKEDAKAIEECGKILIKNIK